MSDTSPQSISGYVNFRDLGGHHTPDGPVRSGRVFRSDSLAHVNAADVEHLVEERGVRTVVDLRGVTEVDAYPNHPMREAGATIHHVPLIDPAKREESGFEWETMTLVDLYRFILESAGPQFVEVMQIIAEPANHPLVFHCAAGQGPRRAHRRDRARSAARSTTKRSSPTTRRPRRRSTSSAPAPTSGPRAPAAPPPTAS